jgi:hypothetical protein
VGKGKWGGGKRARRQDEFGQRLDTTPVNRENGAIKTTIDLPEALVREVKRHALNRRQKLKDAVAELLREGLAVSSDTPSDAGMPTITTDEMTGLPLIVCRHAAAQGEELTPDRVADILLAQEVEWHHAAGR